MTHFNSKIRHFLRANYMTTRFVKKIEKNTCQTWIPVLSKVWAIWQMELRPLLIFQKKTQTKSNQTNQASKQKINNQKSIFRCPAASKINSVEVMHLNSCKTVGQNDYAVCLKVCNLRYLWPSLDAILKASLYHKLSKQNLRTTCHPVHRYICEHMHFV